TSPLPPSIYFYVPDPHLNLLMLLTGFFGLYIAFLRCLTVVTSVTQRLEWSCPEVSTEANRIDVVSHLSQSATARRGTDRVALTVCG
ncbi:MAG TPA: hypothetical protein VKP88_08100, partial [Candidatus Paceibacterota bacterium]|nr:hypothetical protein [Candidatus Paceibacterota bacterium]